ncbi:MAG: hypothetical protein AAFZ74_03020 [Pseudomonadota bacterium]
MVRTWLILSFLVLGGCSAGSKDPTSTGESMSADEPPFYRIDKNASGPLSMPELQVNIPQELDDLYTESMRTCFLATVEDLASSAGDPETLDPSTVTFLPTDGSWQELTKFHKRNLLAQSIISEAGVLCT